MKGCEVPEDFLNHFTHAVQKTVGPPAGVSREHCIDAKALVTDEWESDGMGRAWIMFFEPDENDLAVLSSGGRIKLSLRGLPGLIPHSIGVW